MITHFISSMAVLFLSAGLQSIRGDVCTLLKVSTSANKLPGSERSSLETNGAHFTGRPLQPLWFVSLLMGAEVPGPQAICFLECQSEREQPASLNSLKKKKSPQHQVSSSQNGLPEDFLFTSPHYHTQALQIESLMPTGCLTHHRGDCWSCLIGRPGKAIWKLPGWLTEAMEKRRSQVEGWIVLAPFNHVVQHCR